MKKVLRNIFLLALLSQAIIGCRWITSAGTPFFYGTNFKVPDGTPTFQKGFRDGCSTLLSARGNDFYRSRYSYRYDPSLIGNTEYRFGHQRGYSFCFQSTTGPMNIGSFDKFLFPHGNNAFINGAVGSINNSGLFGSGPGNNSAFSTSLTTPGNGLDGMFDVLQKGNDDGGVGGGGSGTAFTGNIFWASGSSGYLLGW